MKYELGGKIVIKFVGLRAKTYSLSDLIDYGSGDKKKRKLKFKNCLEATQLENKINNVEKHKIYIDHIKENHK